MHSITDPIGNMHTIHKACKDEYQEEFRAMPYEKEMINYMYARSATMNYDKKS